SHFCVLVTKFFLYLSVFVPCMCTLCMSTAIFFKGVPSHVCRFLVFSVFGIHIGSILFVIPYLALFIKTIHLKDNLLEYRRFNSRNFCIDLRSLLQYILYSG